MGQDIEDVPDIDWARKEPTNHHYGTLGGLTNEIALNVSRRHLDPIYNYCEANGLPRLAVLGVNQETGVPGDRYPGPRETIDADREAVYGYDWFNIAPPTIAQLRGDQIG